MSKPRQHCGSAPYSRPERRGELSSRAWKENGVELGWKEVTALEVENRSSKNLRLTPGHCKNSVERDEARLHQDSHCSCSPAAP